MEDKELRERLSRIEKHLGMEPYDMCVKKPEDPINTSEQSTVSVQHIKIDRIGELLAFIAEKRKEVKEAAFLDYLKKMEETLCREQVKLDDLASNLHYNYEVYLKRSGESVPMSQSAEESQSVVSVANESVEDKTVEDVLVPEPSFDMVVPVEEKKLPSAPVKKKDMEFGVGAVVLSIIGALFIIAALVIFGLNFMDNLQQGIFFYVLAGVVIAFSEFVLRKHLERFAQAVTGIGICVLYTATILNYLYLHTMNSVVALVLTVAVSVFALLLSRQRESASLRMIGILGCYVSLMPLDEFQSQTEFIIPCVILLIVNVIYLLLPVESGNRSVRNVHSTANVVASGYLMFTAWISEIQAVWVIVFLIFMLVIHYGIYYKSTLNRSLKGFFISGQILLHLFLAFAAFDEKIYIATAVVAAIVHIVAVWLYRDGSARFVGVHCWSVFLAIASGSMTEGEFLVSVAVIYVIYHVLPLFWKKEFSISNKIVTVVSALLFLANMNSDSNMQYVLLGAIVVSILCAHYDKVFHEIAVMSVLWAFGLFGFGQVAIAIPLSLIFLLMCVALFTKFEAYRDDYTKYLVGFAWVYNGLCLLTSMLEMYDPNRISMAIILVVESALLMLLFSETSGTQKQNIVKCRAHALGIFYTYMVFAFGIELPIAVSILLMVIAVASVSAGFLLKIKSVRVYGLCMSLFVCGKLLLVDFADAQSADRVISFFVVGVIALAISYLYMRIERSLAEKESL